MNAITTVEPTGIRLPTEATAAMQLARELSTARMIPTVFQKSPADIFLVMNVCQRYGFDFFSTIWECSLIKNRLFFSGKMVAAMINASGYLADRLSYEYSGEGDDRMVTVSARLSSENEARSVPVELKKVRTNAEAWRTQPDQQLAYAGARIWGRRHTPEVLLGMMFEGEIIDITPTSVVTHEPLAGFNKMPDPAKDPPDIAQPDEQTGEVPLPVMLPPPTDGWRLWAQQLMGHVRNAADASEVAEWLDLNDTVLQVMKEAEPKMARLFNAAVDEQLKKFGGDEEQPGADQ